MCWSTEWLWNTKLLLQAACYTTQISLLGLASFIWFPGFLLWPYVVARVYIYCVSLAIHISIFYWEVMKCIYHKCTAYHCLMKIKIESSQEINKDSFITRTLWEHHFFYLFSINNKHSYKFPSYFRKQSLLNAKPKSGAPVGMWTQGRVHTKFWQPP